MEEFSRHGVEALFIKSPQASTPEEKLLLQFQGMIAEYERAQIAERSRRGKRHRAKSGLINVLSGAPYGFRYVRKTESSAAYYEVIEEEAEVVRKIFRWYTEESSSIGGMARRLTSGCIPTRYGKSIWDRSTVWAMLRNPAYKGTACFGKTEIAERKKITRPLRKRGGFSQRCSANRERPKEEWIEIAVPSIVSNNIFALAQERLERNKQFSSRRTREPTLLQGILVCSMCGYALYRSSARTSKRKLYYYRCLGSDNYRHPKGRVCSNRPIRQDYLDEIVWNEVVHLIESPELIIEEINRRIEEAKSSNPTKMRKDVLIKEITRVQKGIDRLLNAFQEGIMELPELRVRIQGLRKRGIALKAELHSLEVKMVEQGTYLQLVDKIDDFLNSIRKSAECLEVSERQKVLRLIVKEILVGPEKLTIKHSIPAASPSGRSEIPGYLLRGRSHFSTVGEHCFKCS